MTLDGLIGATPLAGRWPGGRPLAGGDRADGGVAVTLTPFALAGLSGAMFATAFPPLSWTLTAWFALVPLFVACASLSPRRAALAGVCWTATAGAGVASFVPAMLSGYFGLAAVPSWIGSLAIVLGLHGVFIITFSAWLAWLAQRGAAHPLLIAGGWVACEVARTYNPLGSPWALLATSQVPWTAMVQSADLGGSAAVSLLIAAVNACAAAVLVPALRGGRFGLAIWSVLVWFFAAFVYGEIRLAQRFDAGPDVAVAVVQAGATPERSGERAARLARHVALSEQAAAAHTRLIVWPEHAVDGYVQEPSRARSAVLQLAARIPAELVLGGARYEASADGTRYHNSAFLVRDGAVAARYDKRLLVPFAEDDRLARALGAAPSGYVPGSSGLVLAADTLRVAPLLCVEAMFPGLAREAVGQGAELLVNLSNDTWFSQPAAARQQLDLAALRAVENRRYLVRAASTGFSAVIDPHGRTQARSEHDTYEVLTATVRAAHGRTPYQRWGESIAWLLIAAVSLATLRALFDPTLRSQPSRCGPKAQTET